MRNEYAYRLVPQWNAAFKIKKNCCYDKIIYQGAEIGLAPKMDRENELIGILLCCIFDPQLEILELSESDYLAILNQVNSSRTKARKLDS